MSSHAAAADEAAPKALKKYEILGPLAKGGMAELFLARTGGLGGFERLLVIKRIRPELARDTELVRMFLDEARTVASLHHSNIVHIYDVDLADGSVFYAMEHLHGQHVAAMLERARNRGIRVPLDAAIAIGVSVAAGLHYAHERWGPDGTPLDIVHRDVAPNNVIVTYDGNVKLIDFGIAKSAKNLSNTRFGLFKGKLPYAAPEQIRCEPIDRRTDVFSLGLLIYELTTGHVAYSAENEYELLRVMTEAVVPLPRLRDKAYPRELEAILQTALAKDREQRHPSAQALQRELEVFASKGGLDLSSFALARFMSRLFDDELNVWHTARRAGVTLEQHIITRTTGLSAVVAPSKDFDLEDDEPLDDGDAPALPRPTATMELAIDGPEVVAVEGHATSASDIAPASDIATSAPGLATSAPEMLEVDDATRMRVRPAPRRALGLGLGMAAVGLLVGAIGAQWLGRLSEPSASSGTPAGTPASSSAASIPAETAPQPVAAEASGPAATPSTAETAAAAATPSPAETEERTRPSDQPDAEAIELESMTTPGTRKVGKRGLRAAPSRAEVKTTGRPARVDGKAGLADPFEPVARPRPGATPSTTGARTTRDADDSAPSHDTDTGPPATKTGRDRPRVTNKPREPYDLDTVIPRPRKSP